MPNLPSDPLDDRLTELTAFGSNPGALLARSYIPDGIAGGAPLVVVLHGCTQSASSYNRGAGWTSAADEHGFAVLFPEQQRANNPNLCFNWFSPAHAGRGRGEPLSIVQMVQAMCDRHALDPRKVYITGLSAGGAMTAVMLATYPDVFAGGASIAGLPFGTATSVPEAFERMRGQAERGPDQLTRLVTSASNHTGRWPTLSVWHGSSDRTVDASNAGALVDQWRGLHGVDPSPTTTETVDGHIRRTWKDQDGREVIEEYVVADMGHGTPIDAVPAEFGEMAGPYMLDVGLSSTRRIIRFWGLDDGDSRQQVPVGRREPEASALVPRPMLFDGEYKKVPERAAKSSVQDVIEKALRSAGLMS